MSLVDRHTSASKQARGIKIMKYQDAVSLNLSQFELTVKTKNYQF